MPLYLFDVQDGLDDVEAVELDLSDVRAAKVEAFRLASDILRDAGPLSSAGGAWRIEVRDDGGRPLFHMDFLTADVPASMREVADA